MGEMRLANAMLRQQAKAERVLKLREVPVLFVSFAELVVNPASEIARISDFMGALSDPLAAQKVVDPKLHRERIQVNQEAQA